VWERQVGERISKLRKERNLSRVEFGELIGLSERYIGKIERGNVITVDAIIKICRKMNVSADYIIFGNHDPIAVVTALDGLTHEQAQVVFDIAMSVIKFLNTDTGNNALIQEVLRKHCQKKSNMSSMKMA
jgi:transcriptional regulator with XRE-family HTH domain